MHSFLFVSRLHISIYYVYFTNTAIPIPWVSCRHFSYSPWAYSSSTADVGLHLLSRSICQSELENIHHFWSQNLIFHVSTCPNVNMFGTCLTPNLYIHVHTNLKVCAHVTDVHGTWSSKSQHLWLGLLIIIAERVCLNRMSQQKLAVSVHIHVECARSNLAMHGSSCVISRLVNW